MTRNEIIDLVETTFDSYGIKTVSKTDVEKSAYVPNLKQKKIFEYFNINPMDRRQDIQIKELFSNRILTISYYATLRVGANRAPEPRMGLQDLISYLSVGDEILFTHDHQNIFIYNLSRSTDSEIEENIYSQIDINLLRNRASNINPHPNQVMQTIITYPRSNTLKNYVKRRSNCSCEMPNCNYIGFYKNNGEAYIEVHHVIPLAEGGEDSIDNTVALCPNCHRAIHYAVNKEDMKQILLDYLRNL
jgi:5-methylcytosine-specific restriction endonuclease McrA